MGIARVGGVEILYGSCGRGTSLGMKGEERGAGGKGNRRRQDKIYRSIHVVDATAVFCLYAKYEGVRFTSGNYFGDR